MNPVPQNQAKFDMQVVVNSMEWGIASDREIEGRKTTVKNATPSQEFWTAWRSAKAMVKEAGLSASKNDEGAWVVEWISDCTESPAPPFVAAVADHTSNDVGDGVANLPPGRTAAALSESQIDKDDDAPEKIEKVSPDFFSPNPHSTTLYSQVVSPALLESVANDGVKVPVRALRNGKLIDGWQRVEAAKSGQWKWVPTIFVDISPEDELHCILSYNAQRIKTMPDRLREYRAYLGIERERAPERSGIRTDLNQGLPDGHIQFGKSHELAAKKVGLCGTSARNGLQVLEEIERRSGSDDAEEALKLLTEKSVTAAWKFANAHGWINSAVKAKKQKGPKASDGNTEATATMLVESAASCREDKSEEELATSGWLTDNLIDIVISDVASPNAEEADELRKTISYLRPRLYLVVGTMPEASVIKKLHATARVIQALADKYSEIANHHSPPDA